MEESSRTLGELLTLTRQTSQMVGETTLLVRQLVAKLAVIPDDRKLAITITPKPDDYDCPEYEEGGEEPQQNSARFEFGEHGGASKN
jgi:hypothetical protein